MISRFPGTWGSPLAFPLETGEEDEKIGSLAEDAAGGGRLKVVSAEVFVEALQAAFFGEVFALRFADAGEDVVVAGEPSIIFGEQDERRTRLGFSGLAPARSFQETRVHAPPGTATRLERMEIWLP